MNLFKTFPKGEVLAKEPQISKDLSKDSHRIKMVVLLLGTLFFVFIFISCTKESPSPSAATGVSEKLSEADMLKNGQRVYSTQCVSCHGPDPKKDGSLGPAIFGSSLELIKARVETATYPEGYTPKRPTKMMQPLPHLKNEIENLHKFLNTNP